MDCKRILMRIICNSDQLKGVLKVKNGGYSNKIDC